MQSTTMRPQASALPSAAKGRQAVKVMAVSAPEKPASNAPAVPAGATHRSRVRMVAQLVFTLYARQLAYSALKGTLARLQWQIGLVPGSRGKHNCKDLATLAPSSAATVAGIAIPGFTDSVMPFDFAYCMIHLAGWLRCCRCPDESSDFYPAAALRPAYKSS